MPDEGISLEADEQPIGAPAEAPDPDDALPEGTIEVQGRQMVEASIVASERKRIRETERAAHERELEPMRQRLARAEQLEARLAEVQPYIDHLRQHGLPQVAEQPAEQAISEQEALDEARDLELYEPGTGKPDLARARRIIAKRRTETQAAAQEAAQSVLAPVTKKTATDASGQNFAWAASQKDDDGQPLVDKNELAQLWGEFHRDVPELTADPRVARVLLAAAVGNAVMSGKRPARERSNPVFSEAPGGRSGAAFTLTDLDRKFMKAGLTQKDLEHSHKTFKPGQINNIGE